MGYSSKPDCFKKAAGNILLKCQDLGINEGARVDGDLPLLFYLCGFSALALRMTLLTLSPPFHSTSRPHSCHLYDIMRSGDCKTQSPSIRMREI